MMMGKKAFATSRDMSMERQQHGEHEISKQRQRQALLKHAYILVALLLR
jgi:hypothetical protein